ncbi:ATP-binding cassette domain-containing protein [bacterium]|nr:ATP-binding cassette domain-containing protein [bacterium]
MGLIVKDIVKKRYHTTLLDKVSLRIKSNSVTLLSGSVHSGRTTLFHIIAKVLKPNRGNIRYPKGEVAIALEKPQWVGRLDRVLDIVKQYDLLYPSLNSELVAGYIPKIINENKTYNKLSIREKLFLINALTLFSGATVLLFDEPFHYMTDEEKIHFMILLNNVARDGAVAIISVFGTNDLVEFVDDFIVMREGVITYAGSVKEALVKHRIVRSIEGLKGKIIGPLIDSFLIKTGEAAGWEPTLEEILHAYTHYTSRHEETK